MDNGHSVAMALREAYWTMHRQADASLLPADVTANQFVLLSLLNESDAITQRELVERASSDANTVRAMLLVLERKGLITRNAHPTDRRAWSVCLSPQGRRIYRRMWQETNRFREQLIAEFKPQEIDTLLKLLGRLTNNMSANDKHIDPQPPQTKRSVSPQTF